MGRGVSQWEASHSVLSRGHASLVVCLPVCQLPLLAPDQLPRRERDVRKSDPNVWWCTTELPYARPTAASMRAMSAGSRTPRASAVMHSRSSVRFFTPKTTVATPARDSVYRCARERWRLANLLRQSTERGAAL